MRHGLTSNQLCSVVGMVFQRFETKRRRLKEAATLRRAPDDNERANNEDFLLLVKDAEGGKWSRYDFEDAFLLGATIALERAGLDFNSAAVVVSNAGGRGVLNGAADSEVWLGVYVTEDRNGITGRGHFHGPLSEVSIELARHREHERKYQSTDEVFAVVLLNASEIARKIKARIERLGFEVHGADLTPSNLERSPS